MISPQFIMYAASPAILFMPQSIRKLSVLMLMFCCIILSFNLPIGDLVVIEFDRFTLRLFQVNSYTHILLPSLLFIASAIILYTKNSSKWELFFQLLYSASGAGVLLAGDLLSLLISLELMAITAMAVIACGSHNDDGCITRYAAIHFLAGALVFAGLAIQYSRDHTINLVSHAGHSDVATILLLTGLLINCASFPLCSWVSDSYSKASIYSNPLLACFTTKVSLYVLLNLFSGSIVLLYFGVATVIFSAIFSALELNIRKLLNYGLIGQMGLLIVGVSFSGELSAAGSILQIAFGTAYQCLMFIIAGLVIERTGVSNLKKMGNLWKKMPGECLSCLLAILATAATPGTVIFISKSMITNQVQLYNEPMYYCFTAMSLLLFIINGLKFFWFTFIAQNEKVKYTLIKSRKAANVSLFVLSLMILLPSCFSEFLIPVSDYSPYHVSHLLYQGFTVLVSTIIFLCFRKLLLGRITFDMDLDWIYRRFLLYLAKLLEKFVLFMIENTVSVCNTCTEKSALLWHRCYKPHSGSSVALSLSLIAGVIVFLCLNL